MSTKPPISIILNVDQIDHLVIATIDSILNQSFSDFELILINKSSSAFSRAQKVILNDSRVVQQPIPRDSDTFEAIKQGLKIARGKYLCMLNSSVILLRDKLQVQWGFMEANPKVGCMGSSVEFISTDGQMIHLYQPPSRYPVLKAALFSTNCLIQSTLIFRTAFLVKFNLRFNGPLKGATEYDFIVRCAHSFPVTSTDKVLLQYRITEKLPSFRRRLAERASMDKVRIRNLRQFKLSIEEHDIRLHLQLMRNEYLNDLELKQAIVWLDRLVARNQQLKLYKPKPLFELFQNILQQAVAKNQLGGWSIEREMIAFIKTELPFIRTILEFGSGVGTDALLKTYKVISVEHEERYAYKRAKNHTCVYSPLEENWYARDKVQKAIKKNPDLLLIDGPPGKLREGLLRHLDMFSDIHIPIIFDDVDRNLDMQVMIAFCNATNYSYRICHGNRKTFGFCVPKG